MEVFVLNNLFAVSCEVYGNCSLVRLGLDFHATVIGLWPQRLKSLFFPRLILVPPILLPFSHNLPGSNNAGWHLGLTPFLVLSKVGMVLKFLPRVFLGSWAPLFGAAPAVPGGFGRPGVSTGAIITQGCGFKAPLCGRNWGSQSAQGLGLSPLGARGSHPGDAFSRASLSSGELLH